MEFLYHEAHRFVSTHQSEFKLAKMDAVCAGCFLQKSLHHMAQDLVHPGQRQQNGAFQGPGRRIQDSQSDEED